MSGEHSFLDYKCQPFLPKDIRNKALLPRPKRLFRSEDLSTFNNCPICGSAYSTGFCFSNSYYQYPETELYDVLVNCCYPDPPDYHIARFKDWIYAVDPGLFPNNLLRDFIKERTDLFSKDRERIIKSYCRENKLDPSDFPPLDLGPKQKLVFTDCGPKRSFLDLIDRWCRRTHAPWYLRIVYYEVGILVSALLLWLNFFTEAERLLVMFLCIELVIWYLNCAAYIRSVRQQPIVQPMFNVDLNWLMTEIKEFKPHRFYQDNERFHIPEMRDAFTQLRKHRNKSAYIIRLTTEVPLNPPRWAIFCKPKELDWRQVKLR